MPQPIDMQTEMARATLADRVQQAVERAAMAAAMRAQVEQEEEQVLGETQVRETPESESESVDPELKRRNPFIGRRKRGASEDGSETGKGQTPPRPAGPEGHHFDVSI